MNLHSSRTRSVIGLTAIIVVWITSAVTVPLIKTLKGHFSPEELLIIRSFFGIVAAFFIARGLMPDPRVLLLDEPSLGLAPKIVKEVFAKVKEINAMRQTAIVVVEHNIKSLVEISDKVYVLDKGKVVAQGDPKTLIASNIMEKVFLGEM